jgi:hypothetical protein
MQPFRLVASIDVFTVRDSFAIAPTTHPTIVPNHVSHADAIGGCLKQMIERRWLSLLSYPRRRPTSD